MRHMLRVIKFFIVGGVFFFLSCEECTRCSCTYTETIINQTLNGEEEEIITHTTYVWNEEDSTYFTEECVKGDDQFTIKSLYALEEETSTLDNMVCTCTDF